MMAVERVKIGYISDVASDNIMNFPNHAIAFQAYMLKKGSAVTFDGKLHLRLTYELVQDVLAHCIALQNSWLPILCQCYKT